MNWRDYPMSDDAHNTRPWWRLIRSRWTRSDGEVAGEEVSTDPAEAESDLTRLDGATPLAAPDPKVGQVWLWKTGRDAEERFVCAVFLRDGARTAQFAGTVGSASKEWPPRAAIACVCGPGSPWERA
jgi:hypothetical protein